LDLGQVDDRYPERLKLRRVSSSNPRNASSDPARNTKRTIIFGDEEAPAALPPVLIKVMLHAPHRNLLPAPEIRLQGRV
jgi:hypothetical protein